MPETASLFLLQELSGALLLADGLVYVYLTPIGRIAAIYQRFTTIDCVSGNTLRSLQRT